MKDRSQYRESELEQAFIDKLQEFLLEPGKGFVFVARQKRITTEPPKKKSTTRYARGHRGHGEKQKTKAFLCDLRVLE